jgi:uncharacterized membrane protein required for colicin V production
MTIFDLIVLGGVALSALSGYNRGAAAELLGLFAMAFSAIATIAFLPATAPIVRHLLHAGWLSAAAAAVITFVIVFMFLRLVAAMLTSSINRSVLGGANRFGGLIFGGLRGVVFLGLFALVFNRATPAEMKPGWITGGFTYPLATDAGRALGAFLPKKVDLTGGFSDQLGQSIREESAKSDEETPAAEQAPSPAIDPAPRVRRNPPPSERAKRPEHGYTKRARDSVDALVERSN